MAGRFVERDELNVIALDALAEISHFGKCDDGMTIMLSRHVIDQVDDAIFQSAGIEAIHDVGDKGAGISH
jgi:hypothetical protein